jgi:hypothetical protein
MPGHERASRSTLPKQEGTRKSVDSANCSCRRAIVALVSSGNTKVAPNRRTEFSLTNLGGFGLEINTLMFFLLVESGIMPPSPQDFTACPSPFDSKDAKGRIFIECYRPLTRFTAAVFWANQLVSLIKINVVDANFVGFSDHVPITERRMRF